MPKFMRKLNFITFLNLKDFMNCKPDDSKPTIAFISKMFVAEKDCIAKKLFFSLYF